MSRREFGRWLAQQILRTSEENEKPSEKEEEIEDDNKDE